MKQPKRPSDEDQRLAALKEFQILDTLAEQQFDDLTLLASSICQTPIALISLVDENRQWFKSKYGLAVDQTPREIAFCSHAINENQTFIVEDSHKDERFKHNPLVTGQPLVRFYAGAQLTSSEGYNLGTLCVIDHQPRKLSIDQIDALRALSRTAVALMEKSRTNREFEKQSKFLASVMSAMPDLVSYLDREFRYQYANSAYEKWFGLKSESILGRKIEDVLGKDIFQIGRKYLERALTGEIVEFQLKLPYVVGGQLQPRTVRANYIPDVDRSGKINGIFAIVTDLTDKAAALEKLEFREREVQRIFDALPALVGHWDVNQCNISANQAYARYFQKSPNQIKGMHAKDLLGPEIYQMNLPYIQNVLAGKAQTFERSLTLADGTTSHTLANYLPESEGGSIRGFFVIVTDISEIKVLERERKILEAKMIASSKLAELGEMAGGIAHEINTPLGVIAGRVGNLIELVNQNGVDTNFFASELSKIETTTERIAKIISGLRAFSRSAENDPMSQVSISMLIQNTLELCQERFKNHGIELRVKFAKELNIQCRESQISQILMNLLGNAFDAVKSLPEKWVALEIETSEDSLRFFVTDSGRGIPDPVSEKMMQPFFTTKELGHGTGLGLSVSLGLAQAHNGKLFYVRGGSNTQFCLELPFQSRPSLVES